MTLRLFYSFVINENKEIFLDVLCCNDKCKALLNKNIWKIIDHDNTMDHTLQPLYSLYSIWETKDVNSQLEYYDKEEISFLLNVFAGYYHGYET